MTKTMINAGMYLSRSSYWATPDYVFDPLNEIYRFDLDVCAWRRTAKTARYISPRGLRTKRYKSVVLRHGDGLTLPWHQIADRCWMNPVYGRQIGKWIKKAVQESLLGCEIVTLIPARTDTIWYQDWILPYAYSIGFVRGRIHFGNAINGAPFPSHIVRFVPGERLLSTPILYSIQFERPKR